MEVAILVFTIFNSIMIWAIGDALLALKKDVNKCK
jgi:hypothetical protein